jgi:hypothetical protein
MPSWDSTTDMDCSVTRSWSQLPDDVFHRILDKLCLDDRIACATVCTSWNRSVDSSSLGVKLSPATQNVRSLFSTQTVRLNTRWLYLCIFTSRYERRLKTSLVRVFENCAHWTFQTLWTQQRSGQSVIMILNVTRCRLSPACKL